MRRGREGGGGGGEVYSLTSGIGVKGIGIAISATPEGDQQHSALFVNGLDGALLCC